MEYGELKSAAEFNLVDRGRRPSEYIENALVRSALT
jgi:hypothetical protein